MNENKRTPQIRFKGFTDDWEQRKAEEICSISTGKSNTQDKIDDGRYPFYVRSEIVEHSNRYLYDEEAVLTVGDGVGTGKVFHYVNGKYDLHQRVYRCFDFNHEIFPKYYFYYFSTHFYNRVMSMTAKTSVDSVRYEMISEMDFMLPKYDEQKKISSLINNIDNLITLHQRKCDKLVNMKKSMLEKMFPKNSEKVPEIRFKGFTDDWEQRKLKEECIELLAGGDLDKSKVVENGNYPIYANALTNAGLVGFYNDSYRVKAPAVTITGRGEIGYAIARNRDFTPVVRLIAIRTKHNNFFLSNGINRLNIFSESTGVPQLTIPQVEKIELYFPQTMSEENKLGELFSNIDNLITLHQRKLEKLNSLKKSMLEKMFV